MLTTNKWPDGTPMSRNNAFDWRSQEADRGWRITSIKTECGAKGAAVTSPKIFHVFQKDAANDQRTTSAGA